MPIKSFRGKIADAGIDQIHLSTNDGSIGYRIRKFQIFHTEPGELEAEHTVKLYTVPQTVPDNSVDFSDNRLLGVAYLNDHDGVAYAPAMIVVFDQMTFNQDIYVTHVDTNENYPCNYYIELEQIKLNDTERTVATLKDIRND